MYPNILHEKGIESMHEYLKTRSNKSISINSLFHLASIGWENNYFKNGKLKYHQKYGTAIGTKVTLP